MTYCPQDPDDYLFDTIVRENIEYGQAQLDVSRDTAASRVEELAPEPASPDLLSPPPFDSPKPRNSEPRQQASFRSARTYSCWTNLSFQATPAITSESLNKCVTTRGLPSYSQWLDLVPLVDDRVALIGRPDHSKQTATTAAF